MERSTPDSIVFEKGTREIKCKNGIVTVIAPRDITLGEIQKGLERMVLDATEKREQTQHAAC